MARGQINSEVTGESNEEIMARLSEDLSSLCRTSADVSRLVEGAEGGALWLSDRSEMSKSGISLRSIPPGVESMLVQRIAGKG